MPTSIPEFAAFASVFTNPIALHRFMMLRHMRTLFWNVEVTALEQTAQGHVRSRETIPARLSTMAGEAAMSPIRIEPKFSRYW